MWTIDEKGPFDLYFTFTIDQAFTYGDIRQEHTDKSKRERIRECASPLILPLNRLDPQKTEWAFRIVVRKAGRREFDIENVPKLYIDAFCARQIHKDRSQYDTLGLYSNDTIDYVVGLQVVGERITGTENTKVEVFYRNKTSQPPTRPDKMAT